jgi:hypothetical protein
MATHTHKGFNLWTHDYATTVDDFMESIDPTKTPHDGCKRIDAARIAMAHSSACIILMPVQIQAVLKMQMQQRNNDHQACAGALVFAPNRIQRKHLTTDSRLRNLMHGGILGVFARKLTLDPTQSRQWNQPKGALCIVQRANNADGCAHVKWSIPEFQYRFNMGVRIYKQSQSPFSGLTDDDALALLNQMNTVEGRQAFLDECSAIANAPHHSRVVRTPENDAPENDAAVYHVRLQSLSRTCGLRVLLQGLARFVRRKWPRSTMWMNK